MEDVVTSRETDVQTEHTKVVVFCDSCTLASPLKLLVLTPHPRPIISASLGFGTQASVIFKPPCMILMDSQGWKMWHYKPRKYWQPRTLRLNGWLPPLRVPPLSTVHDYMSLCRNMSARSRVSNPSHLATLLHTIVFFSASLCPMSRSL